MSTKQYQKKYRQRHIEHFITYSREYYQNNKERILKERKEYYQDYKERIKKQNRKYRQGCIQRGLCCKCGQNLIEFGRSNTMCKDCLNKQHYGRYRKD